MTVRLSLMCLVFGAATVSCSDDDKLAPGTIQVTVYGEDEIEDELSSNDVADGWTIDFSRFLVVLSDVSVGNDDDEGVFSAPAETVFDLTKPSNGMGHVLGSGAAPGGTYDLAAYTIGPATAAATAGNVTADDVALMSTGGYSVYLQGTATKGGASIDFAWGFTSNTHYGDCETNAKVDGNTATTQITIHAEHIFFDSRSEDAADIRFQAIADADADHSGDVTLAELAAVDLSTLSYDAAGDTNLTTLAAFIAAQVTTIGHVDGEGECEATH